MINDVEMLGCILRNAEMGCQGISDIRKKVRNKNIDKTLCNQLVRYGKIYQSANSMLHSRGAEVNRIGPMTKAMTNYAAARDLHRDSSSSHIAEMLIKGNTMGMNKIVRNIREYDGKDETISSLARQMLEAEEESIREIKTFL